MISRPKQLQSFEQLQHLHLALADAFCDAVKQTLESRDLFCVSLSGGSTPKRLYQLLSERDLPWDKIQWFWGDERNVPHGHPDSNASMVQEALLDHVPVPAENIHPVPVNIDDPASAALEYQTILRQYFVGDAFPRWDLALLGMGDDAHTASLFPGTKALEEGRRWFVENWVEKFDAYRYTLTAPAINSAKQAWFVIAGSGKQSALSQVWSEERQPSQYPAQLIQPTRWFVSGDALPPE